MQNRRLSTKLNKYFEERDNIRLTFVYEIGLDKIVIIVTQNDKVYKFDSDLSAELGLSDDCNIIESAIVEKLCDKKIIDFANGDYYTLARTRDGKVYTWLNSRKKNCENPNKIEPHLIKFFEHQKLVIKDIKCGDLYSLALTQTGDVYIWGCNYGESPTIPFKLKFYSIAIDIISCGARYFLAIARNNTEVFYWKVHEFGQNFSSYNVSSGGPKHVDLPEDGLSVLQISCGKNHSLLLTDDGRLSAYGSNYWGQIGIERYSHHIHIPAAIHLPEKIKEIATHYKHNISAALSESGNYYVWGKCGEEVNKRPQKSELTSFKDIFAEYCRITYKTVEGNLDIDDTFIYNGRYEKRFKQLNRIGRGSFGKVYEVKDKFGFRKYAVKIVKVKTDDDLEKGLLKEFKVSSVFAKLNNNYVVRYYDSWIENNIIKVNGSEKLGSSISLYIRMELCFTTLEKIIDEMNDNPTLKQNGLLTFVGYYFASQLFIEILESVDFLHTLNPPIMHRDLKPDNILLTNKMENRFVRIADFGLMAFHKYANQLHSKDRGGVYYQAPEVQYTCQYDTKADVYSLGIVLKILFSIDSRSIFPELEGNLESLILSRIQNPLLKTKYDFLIKLSKRMTNKDKTERPDCREILSQRVLWALNRNEINEEIKIDFNGKASKVNEFIYSIIVSKYNS